MDTKNNQPENAGAASRNAQTSSSSATGSNSAATRTAPKADYVNPDIAQPKSTSPDLTASGEQPQGGLIDSALESGKAALESGKKWIEDSGITETVNQQTQNVKDWSKRATSRVGSLSTTQKVVGGAILAAGLGWLAMRGKSGKDLKPNIYGRKGKTGSSFGRAKGYQQDSSESNRGRRAGVLSSMPSFGGSSNITPTPSDSYDRPASSGDSRSRFSGSSTVSDNVSRHRSSGSGYGADE